MRNFTLGLLLALTLAVALLAFAAGGSPDIGESPQIGPAFEPGGIGEQSEMGPGVEPNGFDNSVSSPEMGPILEPGGLEGAPGAKMGPGLEPGG